MPIWPKSQNRFEMILFLVRADPLRDLAAHAIAFVERQFACRAAIVGKLGFTGFDITRLRHAGNRKHNRQKPNETAKKCGGSDHMSLSKDAARIDIFKRVNPNSQIKRYNKGLS